MDIAADQTKKNRRREPGSRGPPTQKTRFYPELGVEVRRSSLNTPVKKQARTGAYQRIVEAGDGLFASRRFGSHEYILDYRFIN